MPKETDSILRVSTRDILMTLLMLRGTSETTLENIRLRLCVDREKKRRGDFLWSTARDTASELRRLGYIEAASLPGPREFYEKLKNDPIRVTHSGRTLIELFDQDRAKAFDELFARMFEEHPYLRSYVRILMDRDLLAPILTSVKDHISDRYSSTTALADDVAKGTLDAESLQLCMERRLGRSLKPDEQLTLNQEIDRLLQDSTFAAASEDSSDFAKKFLLKLNDIVIPTVFRNYNLDFDFRTHRTLWSLGQEFRVWWSTSSHPNYEGTLVFRTAQFHIAADGRCLERIEFDHGVMETGENFLGKLYSAYQTYSKLTGSTYASAWGLRAVFCYENRCQPGVFNRLFDQHYAGSDEYGIHLEIQRTRPRYEEPIMAGRRRIGSVRVTRR